jgi:ADP-heptose:LPS heptosyltransferase
MFKILSRFPEVKISKQLIYRIPPIASFRFQLSGFLLPSEYRIRLNGQKITSSIITKAISNSDTSTQILNIWVNLSEAKKNVNIIQFDFKFFGIFIPVKKIYFLQHDYLSNQLLHDSDSFIPPDKLSSPAVQGHELKEEIIQLPAAKRNVQKNYIATNIKKILLFRLDQLGDFILSLPAINQLKLCFPGSELTILVSNSNEAIAKSIELFHEVVPVSFSFCDMSNHRELSENVREQVRALSQDHHYDLAIDLSPMPETRELLGLINADVKLGFENTDTSMLDTGLLIHAKDPVNTLSNISHVVYPMLLVDLANRILNKQKFRIIPDYSQSSIFSDLNVNPGEYIVIHAGSRNILVRWDMDKFITLAQKLSEAGHHIVIFSDYRLPIDLTKNIINSQNITIIDDKLDFSHFDAIISNAKLFIGNDSGPKHLAALRDINIVSVHSPRTNWSEWGQTNGGYIVSKHVPCAGCAIVNEFECGNELVCIKSISVEDVMCAVNSSLNTIQNCSS